MCFWWAKRSGEVFLISYLGRLGLSGLSFPGIRYHRVVELNVEGLTLEDFDSSLIEVSEAGNVILVIKIFLTMNLYMRD